MAGLLDGMLDSDSMRLGLGLLAAGGPTTDPNRTGIGQRLQEGMGIFDAYKRDALKQQMLEAQMKEWQQKTAREKRLNDLTERKQAALPGLFTGGQSALPLLAGDASTGILPSAGRAAALGTLDVQRALAAGYSPDEIAKLDSLRNVGMDEVARTVKGMQNGREVEQQYDKFGRPVGQGMEQYRAPIEVSTNAQKLLLDPYSRSPLSTFNMEQSPDSKASNAVAWANNAATLRGQNMTDARARDRLSFDMQGGAESVKPKLVDGQWVTAPSNMKAGEVRPAMPSAGRKDANEALELIKTAREIIPKSTGSYIGTGVDQAARLFGASTGGDTAAAQLKALEGALVSKMPKMSGPQSDKDVLLYKQMAGEIGNPTIPGSRKLAALKVIEEIQQRQAGGGSGASGTWAAPTQSPAGGGWSIQKVN